MLRRSFFQKTLSLFAGITTLGTSAVAFAKKAALTMVSPSGAMGKALKYVEASTIADKNCGNCAQYKEEITHDGKKVGKCNLFPGKYVLNGGYCSVWVINPKAKKTDAAKSKAKEAVKKVPMKKK